MISAVEELDSVVRCIEMGAADYLTKPIDPRSSRRGSTPRWPPSACTTSSSSRRRAGRADRTIERQKEELSRFLSPQVAALVSSPEGEQLLAGHRREITVAFCDLRGFTPFAEQADPEEVLGVLREYHAMMGEPSSSTAGRSSTSPATG